MFRHANETPACLPMLLVPVYRKFEQQQQQWKKKMLCRLRYIDIIFPKSLWSLPLNIALVLIAKKLAYKKVFILNCIYAFKRSKCEYSHHKISVSMHIMNGLIIIPTLYFSLVPNKIYLYKNWLMSTDCDISQKYFKIYFCSLKYCTDSVDICHHVEQWTVFNHNILPSQVCEKFFYEYTKTAP